MVLLLGILSLTICIRFSAQAHLRELPKNIDEHPSREYTSLKRKQFRGRPVIIDTNNTNAFTVKENFPQNRIINGRDADPDMNSFFAMILQYNSTTLKWTFSGCGSSLITNCHVLTAAHCVVGSREGRSDGVLVRAWKPYNSNGGVRSHFSPVNSQSSHIKIHPKYNPKTNENDIAIIKMDWCVDPINFPPVDLAKDGYAEGLKEGDSLRASGFGRLFEGGNNALVETLQSVQLPYIPRDTCVSLYGEAIMSRDMICAGYAEGGTDTCIGDSGGPIVQDKEGHTTLVGVTSWGVGCARQRLPGVYSSVSVNYDWIVGTACNDTGVVSDICIEPTPRPTPIPTPSPSLRPIHIQSGRNRYYLRNFNKRQRTKPKGVWDD